MIDGLSLAPLSVPELRKRLVEEEAIVADLVNQYGAGHRVVWLAERVAREVRSELKRRER